MTFIVEHKGEMIGSIVSNMSEKNKSKYNEEGEKKPYVRKQGYIAMLAVEPEYRRLGLGRMLVQKTVDMFVEEGADEIEIETECCNAASLGLY